MPAYDHDRFAPAEPVARVSLRHPDSGASIADVRNALNRIRLLLDGPALNWEELPQAPGDA
jgi:hypothetical protein